MNTENIMEHRTGTAAESIARAFNPKAFIGFITGGDPSIPDNRRFINTMVHAGVGIIEIGIPFSDPIAEGPTIQEASLRALHAHTTPDKLLDLVETLRLEDGITIPLVFMTYLNPVHHYGYERFFTRAAQAGVDAIIIPDLPFEELNEVRQIATSAGVCLISMIAPTSHTRVRMIAAQAEGFIYLVSSLGVTGVRSELSTDLAPIISEIREVTDVPIAVGFGISTPDQVQEILTHADGVIVGSALVNIIATHGPHAPHPLTTFLTTICP